MIPDALTCGVHLRKLNLWFRNGIIAGGRRNKYQIYEMRVEEGRILCVQRLTRT